jgi:hypothetical protein
MAIENAQTTYPMTHDGLKQALAALGRTSAAVTDRLAADGFTGWPHPAHNPVARYLAAVIPGCHWVRVYRGSAGVEDPDQPGRAWVARTPAAVNAFLDAFAAQPDAFSALYHGESAEQRKRREAERAFFQQLATDLGEERSSR